MDGSRVASWLPLIPLLPFLGFLLNGLAGPRLGKRFVSFVAVTAPLVGFALAVGAFLALRVEDRSTLVHVTGPVRTAVKNTLIDHRFALIDSAEDAAQGVLRVRAPVDEVRTVLVSHPTVKVERSEEVAPRSWHGPGSREAGIVRDLPWITVGTFQVSFRFVLDRLSGILCLVVLGVGSLIHIFSVGYMAGEDRGGFARYFAYLNLFTSMMLVLVLAGDLILMFVGWEGVGLCSYLLIGFEYREGWKAEAGIKAFVVNRIGDLGFILGTCALAVTAIAHAPAGTIADLRMDHLNELAKAGVFPPLVVGIASLCLFLGATGKSAQLPLYVWLPDAMAGPTPVSALIHAATMVTAGVYMCCRLHPILEIAQVGGIPVLEIVAIVGALTAFFAATSALAQDDIKKVLAYSTVSQLGYMFIGVGVSAFSAAVFHLVTHAFFKACLFLGSGAVIHAVGTQDMKKMGGLRHALPTTYRTMVIGAAALAGLPIFAGFFSKDMVLGAALNRALDTHQFGWGLVYGLGVVGGFITAFYSTRLIALTFLGEPGEAAKHAHPESPLMNYPLVILAVLSVLGGALGLPEVLPHSLESLVGVMPHYLAPLLEPFKHAETHADAATHHSRELMAIGISTTAAILGVLLGWSLYGNRQLSPGVTEFEQGRGGIRGFLAAAWRIDEAYNRFIAAPIMEFARGLWAAVDDATLDRGLVDGMGRIARGLGELATTLQTGRVARYAAYLATGAVALIVASQL